MKSIPGTFRTLSASDWTAITPVIPAESTSKSPAAPEILTHGSTPAGPNTTSTSSALNAKPASDCSKSKLPDMLCPPISSEALFPLSPKKGPALIEMVRFSSPTEMPLMSGAPSMLLYSIVNLPFKSTPGIRARTVPLTSAAFPLGEMKSAPSASLNSKNVVPPLVSDALTSIA